MFRIKTTKRMKKTFNYYANMHSNYLKEIYYSNCINSKPCQGLNTNFNELATV